MNGTTLGRPKLVPPDQLCTAKIGPGLVLAAKISPAGPILA